MSEARIRKTIGSMPEFQREEIVTMNKYAKLRQRQQEEFNALLGFAFGQKQFDEMMRGWGPRP